MLKLMIEVIMEKQLKQTGAKINFPEEESMLKAWENMHRPPGPDHVISSSGPGHASILAPTHREVDRRCSVISMNQTKPVSKFSLLTMKGPGDMRRPSDIWQGDAHCVAVLGSTRHRIRSSDFLELVQTC